MDGHTHRMAQQGGPSRRSPRWGHWPHPPGYLVLLLIFLAAAVALIEIRVATAAFALAGLSPVVATAALLASLLGSAVNIPLARLGTAERHVEYRRVRRLGVTYLIPVGVAGRTVVAVNVGGAIIPCLVSAYLIGREQFWLDAVIATTVIALLVHLAARPVPGLGITVPVFVPALTSAAVALILHPAGPTAHAAGGAAAHSVGATAALAYVAGSLGTLIGADLTNLGAVRRLRAPMVSIGGAGTFDGVFVTGILAVLLAALL